MKTQVAAFGATLAAAAVAIGATVAMHQPGAVKVPARTVHASPSSSVPVARTFPDQVVGVVSNDLAAFDSACGCHPNVAVHYARWGDLPSSSRKLADAMSAEGASPMLEISPAGTTLSAIIAGRTDRWLRSYADMVRGLQTQVLLSFAPEANGNWYSWDYRHAPPSAEVAAWRHVVTVFRQEHATNARWVWIVNQVWSGSGPLRQLWPGAAYVDETGIDGYFRERGDTFESAFVPTIRAVRTLAPRKPVLITETGASPRAGKERAVNALTAGVDRYGLAGFVWFDIDQGAVTWSHADWSLEHSPPALAAYRQAASAGARR